jgi:hypothetical protein
VLTKVTVWSQNPCLNFHHPTGKVTDLTGRRMKKMESMFCIVFQGGSPSMGQGQSSTSQSGHPSDAKVCDIKYLCEGNKKNVLLSLQRTYKFSFRHCYET